MHGMSRALALLVLLASAMPAAADDYPNQADPRDRSAGPRAA